MYNDRKSTRDTKYRNERQRVSSESSRSVVDLVQNSLRLGHLARPSAVEAVPLVVGIEQIGPPADVDSGGASAVLELGSVGPGTGGDSCVGRQNRRKSAREQLRPVEAESVNARRRFGRKTSCGAGALHSHPRNTTSPSRTCRDVSETSLSQRMNGQFCPELSRRDHSCSLLLPASRCLMFHTVARTET